MKVFFEIDEDGNFKISGSVKKQLNEKNFSSSGKIALDEDEENIFNSFRKFARDLEIYCPANYSYNSNSPSK